MAEEAMIRSMPAEEMPGTLRKRLVVPDERLVLLVDGGEVVGQRGPGEHGLGNWPKPAPDAVQLPQAPFDLRLRIQHLKSGDHHHFDLVWPLTVQVEQAADFYTAWLAEAPDGDTALTELEDHLAGWVWEKAQGRAAQHTLEDLQAEEQLQSALAREMRPQLSGLLGELGLRLVGSQRPQPRTLDDEQAALESMNQFARAARDARFDALFERLEDRQMLADRLAEWGEGPPDPALVELLWEVVDQGPEGAAVQARQAAEALERQVASLRLTLAAEQTENERRFRQMVTRLEKAEGEEPAAGRPLVDPARVLKRLLYVLRIVGTGITLLAALTALLAPHLVVEYIRLRGLSLLFTVVVGALTIFSELFLRHRVRQVREAERRKRAESRASLRRRREADRLVRARIEAGLKQVAGNLEAAWKKAYSQEGSLRDLAVQMREVAREATRFEEQDVRAANYQAARYLSNERVPDDQLSAMLDLDEDLLDRSQSMAATAQTLYEQVNAGQVDEARAALRGLENGLNALRNRFIERGAYLMSPA